MSNPELRAELEKKKARLAALREEKQRKERERNKQFLGDAGREGSPNKGLNTSTNVDDLLQGLDLTPSKPIDGGKRVGYEGSPARSTPRPRTNLSLQIKKDTAEIDIAPREQVSYSKTTQTMGEVSDLGHTLHSFEWDDEFSAAQIAAGGSATTPEDVFDLDGSLTGLSRLPHIGLIAPAQVPTDKADEKEDKPKLPDLSEEEKEQILSSDEFMKVFDRSARILERALTEEVDIFIDYSIDADKQEKLDTGARFNLSRSFFDEKWTNGRCVTAMDTSAQHPELLAVAYSSPSDAPHEPDGVVVVWNTKFKKDSPEYVFHCQSQVTSCCFAKFHPNLLVGGTYSGQIVLWDNRLNKKTPVQKTPLQTRAHTHPVYCMSVVGTQNAHNLVTISSDGRLCSWSLDMLTQPQDSIELSLKQSKQVAATSISFPLNDVNNFIVGAEDGTVYSAMRHGSKQGIIDAFDGHSAPITGVDCHRAMGQVDFTHLYLSSSFDWSVKLWSLKDNKPLYSFDEYQDYVMDVKWSPVHPGLFACVDITGKLDLWNLNQDLEVPAASLFVEGRPALNKLIWLPSGQQICVGDDAGSVWVYDINDALAIPRQDDFTRLGRTLLEIQQSNQEQLELSQTLGMVGS